MITALTTDRLILREYNDADIDDYFRLKSDKETMYYLQDIQLFSQEEANADFANILADMQVIAKLARLVRNLERKQGRIRAEHEFWNEKWITGHFRRTLISYGLYESGKS